MKEKTPIQSVTASAFIIPTDAPESDGTFQWNSTTLVLVEIAAGGQTGLGYTYSDANTARLINKTLARHVVGREAMDIPGLNWTMHSALRNLGACGMGSAAISAVDNALWDLKARLLDLPLCQLPGQCRSAMPIYGSGGFTSYSDEQLAGQLGGWAQQGIPRVKMKVGRDPERDLHRAKVARAAIGADAELFVDANSAYDRKQALYFIERFAADFDVRWMEQPLAPEDHEGMRLLCDRAPARMEITDGEYAYGISDFRVLLESGSVDVVMADTTRCGGMSVFLQAGALCEAWRMPLSSHCAPLQHVALGCSVPAFRHGEFFHDHVRIERMLFEGFPEVCDGALAPDISRSGLGVVFRRADAEKFRVH